MQFFLLVIKKKYIYINRRSTVVFKYLIQTPEAGEMKLLNCELYHYRILGANQGP